MKEKPSTFRKRASKIYFENHGEKVMIDDRTVWTAPCQACGWPLTSDQYDTMHKQHAGMGGASRANTLENVIIGHGHRCGPVNCHNIIDNIPELLRILESSPINVITGGNVDWQEQTENLKQRLSKTSYAY